MIKFFNRLRYAIPVFVTCADLYIKNYIRNNMSIYKTFKYFPLLSIKPMKNTGIGFNLFEQAIFQKFLPYLITIVLTILIYEWWKMKNKFQQTAWSFILGGGIANLIDRYTYGYVLDYFSINLFNSLICNFADISVFIGVLYILYLMKPEWNYDPKTR